MASQVGIALKNARLYEKVVEEKEKLDSIVASMSDGVITLDKELKILSFNPAAENLMGWKEKEVFKKRLSAVFRAEGDGKELFSEAFLMKSFKTDLKGYAYNECNVAGRDGSEKVLSIAFSPLQDEAGDLAGVVGVFRDISKMKEMDQLKSNFIWQPSAMNCARRLTSIKGYIATHAASLNEI